MHSDTEELWMMTEFWMRDCLNILRFLKDHHTQRTLSEKLSVMWDLCLGYWATETRIKTQLCSPPGSLHTDQDIGKPRKRQERSMRPYLTPRTWSNTSPAKIPILQVVTRRAPNLKRYLLQTEEVGSGVQFKFHCPMHYTWWKKEGAPLYDLHPCKRYFLCH